MKYGTVPTVAVVCGDPGAANAVAPVIRNLIRDRKVRVIAWGYAQAATLWKNEAFPSRDLPGSTTQESAARLLREHNVCLLFTGTSHNEKNFEKIFIAAAQELEIPSIALLDYWSNYALRFSKRDSDLAYLPDKVAIMDDCTRDEMIREGFPASHLVVTGQPAFDDLAELRDSFTPDRAGAIRTGLGCGPEDLLVVFASEPLFTGIPGSPVSPGYTREGVIRSLIDALDTIGRATGRRIVLAIRPHPRETPEDFSWIGSGDRNGGTRIIISWEGRTRDIVPAADLVTGMTTILLMEACYLGCIVASIQPGLTGQDILPSNRPGYSTPIYQQEDIIPVLQTLLLDERERNRIRTLCRSLAPRTPAAARVARELYTLCGIE